MKKIILFLLLFVSLTAPVFAYTNNSIYIPNIQRKQAIDVIVTDKMNDHWNVLNANDYSITLRQDMTSMADSVIWGSRFNTTPERRLQYNIVQKDNGVIISVDGQIVTNPRSGYETSTSFADGSIVQEIDKLNKIFLGYYTYGLEYGKLFNMAIVTGVSPISNAYKDGLRQGSIITSINGRPIKQCSNFEVNESARPTATNQELNIIYKADRKSEPKNLILKSEYIKPLINQKENK